MSQKILIVDDEPDILQAQSSYLLRRNYQVLTAKNRNEAIEVIKKESPNLVFCDIVLESKEAGLNVLKHAKRTKPDITVYLVTGLLDKNIAERGLAMGAKELLIKPMSNESLEKKIKEVFSIN